MLRLYHPSICPLDRLVELRMKGGINFSMIRAHVSGTLFLFAVAEAVEAVLIM